MSDRQYADRFYRTKSDGSEQGVEWFPPDKPPPSPYDVLVTLQVPATDGGPPCRAVKEGFYMDGRWQFHGALASEVYESWSLLAWCNKPNPFDGEWT